MRTPPTDPNLITLRWYFHETSVTVWEDANEALPWVLVWREETTYWRREETFQFVWQALARVAAIASAVENDERLVQADVNVPSDRRAFQHLVTQFVTYTTSSRSSAAQYHHTRAGR